MFLSITTDKRYDHLLANQRTVTHFAQGQLTLILTDVLSQQDIFIKICHAFTPEHFGIRIVCLHLLFKSICIKHFRVRNLSTHHGFTLCSYMNLKHFLFCLCLKAQWWGLWFTQAGSCAVSWTPPIQSTRYSNVRQSPPQNNQNKHLIIYLLCVWMYFCAIDCVFWGAVPVHSVAVLNQTTLI